MATLLDSDHDRSRNASYLVSPLGSIHSLKPTIRPNYSIWIIVLVLIEPDLDHLFAALYVSDKDQPNVPADQRPPQDIRNMMSSSKLINWAIDARYSPYIAGFSLCHFVLRLNREASITKIELISSPPTIK